MKTGSFSSWTEAGDLGITVLGRFTPTFNYADKKLYLDPGGRAWSLPKNHSGMRFTKTQPNAIDVIAVRPNSAASAAGIVSGDKIVAVNGKAARDLSSSDFYDLVTARVGTTLRLTVQHGATTRTLDLILR